MTRLLCILLTLLFSVSGPATGANSDFWQSSLAAKTGSGGPLTNLKNWWNAGAENDAAWRALPLKDKVFYEVGQKTLPDGVWQKYANLDPVARGRALVQDQGWLGALKPQGGGWKLGAGETLHTGPTPLIRWAVPRAAGAGAVGGAGCYLYNRGNE